MDECDFSAVSQHIKCMCIRRTHCIITLTIKGTIFAL